MANNNYLEFNFLCVFQRFRRIYFSLQMDKFICRLLDIKYYQWLCIWDQKKTNKGLE